MDIIVYTEKNRLVRDISRLCDVDREAILDYKDISGSQERKGKGGCECPKAIYLVLLEERVVCCHYMLQQVYKCISICL